jgi:hypothetical protein
MLGINSGQGPYLYSYGINFAVGANSYPAPLSPWRTKRSQWRRPAEKILFTETYDAPPLHFTGPGWGYVDWLARRHGQGRSRKTGAVIGTNVSTSFMDGHVAAIDEDFSNDIRQNHLTE